MKKYYKVFMFINLMKIIQLYTYLCALDKNDFENMKFKYIKFVCILIKDLLFKDKIIIILTIKLQFTIFSIIIYAHLKIFMISNKVF